MVFWRRRLKKPDTGREQVLRDFEKKIKYRFKDLNLLNTALTHPSYLNEKQIKDQEDYERMEFLGDSVLGLVVCCHIYNEFPDYAEGILSDIKSHVVSEKALASISRKLGVGPYILFGTGEARTGGRRKNSILANVYESIIGAIYLDGGYEKARQFIKRFAEEDIIVHPPDREASNFKGRLQKYTQQHMSADPHYSVVAEKGPSHSRMYEVEVHVKSTVLGVGKGKSKKEAEQKAAKAGIAYFESRGMGNGKKNKGRRKKNGRKRSPAADKG